MAPPRNVPHFVKYSGRHAELPALPSVSCRGILWRQELGRCRRVKDGPTRHMFLHPQWPSAPGPPPLCQRLNSRRRARAIPGNHHPPAGGVRKPATGSSRTCSTGKTPSVSKPRAAQGAGVHGGEGVQREQTGAASLRSNKPGPNVPGLRSCNFAQSLGTPVASDPIMLFAVPRADGAGGFGLNRTRLKPCEAQWSCTARRDVISMEASKSRH